MNTNAVEDSTEIEALMLIFNKCDISINVDNINWDTDLLKSGHLDSFDLLNVVFALEKLANKSLDLDALDTKISIKFLLELSRNLNSKKHDK